MRKLLAIAVLCVAVPGLAAELQIDPSPVPLDSLFRVVLSGEGADQGSVKVLNLRSMDFVTLDLQDEDGRWVTGYVHAVRPCVCEAEEAAARLDVELGDVLVAATEVGEGLSAATKVAPPQRGPEEPVVRLRRLDTGEREFFAVEELTAGTYVLEVVDRSLSVSCEPDYITDVRVYLGDRELHLNLEEEDATAGRFLAFFQADIRPEQGELLVVLMGPDGEEVGLPWEEGLHFAAEYEGRRVGVPVSPLRAELSAERISLPAGCSQTVHVTKPEQADEYLWYEGRRKLGTGPSLTVFGQAPQYWAVVNVFVRQGIHWGTAEFEYRVAPGSSLTFLDAATEQPASQPWSRDRELKVLLEHAYTEDPRTPPTVRAGVLGENDEQRLTMTKIEQGIWISTAFRPREFRAGAGDVLWALYRDTAFPSCNFDYELLRIK